MAFSELDAYLMIQSLRRKLSKLKPPEPCAQWQHSEWVDTVQTILELERILDLWNDEVDLEKKSGRGFML